MAHNLGDIARLVDGTVVGDTTVVVSGVAVLADANAGDITLVDTAERAARLGEMRAAAAIVPRGVICAKLPTIEVDDIHGAFARLVMLFRPPRQAPRIGVSAQGHGRRTRAIGHNVDIHPGATIGDDVEIGDGATIHAGVQIMAGCKIGAGRHDLSERGAVRKHDRRPALDHSRRRRARRTRLRLQAGRRPARAGRPVRLGRDWEPTSRSAPARRSIAAPTARP